MSTIINEDSTLTKAVAGIVGVASGLFMLGLVSVVTAQPAQAQTKAEMQAQIQSLLQQISQLQSQIDQGGMAAHAGCSADFTQNLTTGDRGQQVMQLQTFLNAETGVSVAQSGPGAPGNETSYFGPLTAQAVTAFQNKHSADVLAPVGLTSGTGYWGPSSRAKANSICQASMTDTGDDTDDSEDTDDSDDSDESDDSDDEDELSGGEASFDEFEYKGSPSNEDASENETQEVLGFEFEADSGDMRVERVDVLFNAVNQSNGTEPFDYLESMTLYHGGDEVAEMDVGDEDHWTEQTDDYWRARFAGLSEIVREGDLSEWTVEVTTQDHLDSGDLDQNFDMYIADDSGSNDGIRAVDAAGVNQYGGDGSNAVTVTFEQADTGELTFRTSANEMDERVVEVDDSNDTNDVDLLNFEMEADNQDILVEDFAASTTVNFGGANGSEVSDVVSTLYLSHDGDVITSENVASNSSTTVETTFDNVDIELEEDEEAEFTISGDIDDTNSQSRYVDGTTIDVSVGDTGYGTFNAEETTGSEDDISSVQNSSAVSAEVAHLYEVAPQFTLESTSVTNASSDDDGNGNDTKATFNIEFSVEADDENDVYVPFYDSDNDASIVASTTDGNGTALSPQASSTKTITKDASSDSSVSQDTDSWRVPSGNTGVFTFQLKANNDDNNDKNFSDRFVASKIESLKWSTTTPKNGSNYQDTSTDLNEFDWNLEDWETDPVSLDS
jgi:hypothetical protein